MYQIPNLKYKTTLCNNWLQGTPCQKSNNCYFAHGQIQLRKIQENQHVIAQRNQIYLQYQSNNNYKTVYCRFFAKGQCKLGAHCTFAHQKRQKRKINKKQINTPAPAPPSLYSYQTYSIPYLMSSFDNYPVQYFQQPFINYNVNTQVNVFDNIITNVESQFDQNVIKMQQKGINQNSKSNVRQKQKQILNQNINVQYLNLQMTKISIQN